MTNDAMRALAKRVIQAAHGEGYFYEQENEVISLIAAALGNAEARGLEEAAEIAMQTSSWREPFSQELGHRERLNECALICEAIRTQAAARREG